MEERKKLRFDGQMLDFAYSFSQFPSTPLLFFCRTQKVRHALGIKKKSIKLRDFEMYTYIYSRHAT